MNFWQIGSGEGRNLADYYKNKGVSAIGPGWIEVQGKEWETLKKDSNSSREASALWNFVNEVKANDIIFARASRRGISLVGIVKEKNGDKIYNLVSDEDGIIEGWDLNHQIEMDWYEVLNSEKAWSIFFKDDYTFPIIRFSAVNGINDKIKSMPINEVKKILNDKDIFKKVEPDPEKLKSIFKFPLDESYCFSAEENRINNTKIISNQNEEYRKIFLVVPFLLRIGWTPDLMEFEVNRADIVLYEDLNHKKPFAIIETKRAGTALGTFALDQVKGYLTNFEKAKPQLLIVTDGERYLCQKINKDEEYTFEFHLRWKTSTIENPILELHPSTTN